MTTYIKHMFVLLAGFIAAGCTLANVEPPPLAGPSEMSLSITMTANPDVLSVDGSSQTLVSVEARDVNGQPAANVPLRVEILADGELVDFGTISARTLVTGTNGRAQFTYTAPSVVAGVIPNVQLSVTPTGTDAAAHIRRVISVRLVVPGSIGVAPVPRFTFIPETPVAFADVRFDGSTSDAGIGAVITSYSWDFGDGSTGTGQIATHQYSAAGSYIARLTVTNSTGLSATSASQVVTVGAGTPPTATMVFSPTAPIPGQSVFFNGTQSVAGPGHRIVSYRWNWGDGTANSSGSTASHKFTIAGTYVVVLTVTDEAGQVGRATTQVAVGVEEE
jgi:PKD repeat protein